MATILRSSPESISRAALELRNGAVVAVPTETVYGLAGHALNEKACRFIFDIKGRPLIDPLIIHIGDYEQLSDLASVPDDVFSLLENVWPGALTVILPKKACVPDIVTAGLPTVAIRMPRHPVMRALLKECMLPLAAPSANPFGYISPTTAEHVQQSLGDKLEFILDGGDCEIGLESTIVNLSKPGEWQILRHGPISAEKMAPFLPNRTMLNSEISSIPDVSKNMAVDTAQIAPGLLERHYSPKTPLFLFENKVDAGVCEKYGRVAIAFLKRNEKASVADNTDVYWLSDGGSMNEIAHNLFALLRKLDERNYDAIFMQTPESSGIGLAINDRLRRAAAKR